MKRISAFEGSGLDELGCGVNLIDPGRRLIYCNKTAEELMGLDRSNCLGKTIDELFPSPQTFDLVNRSGTPLLDQKLTIKNHSGFDVTVHISCLPVLNNGVFFGVIEVFTDIDTTFVQNSGGNAHVSFEGIITGLPRVREIKDRADKLAKTCLPIIIVGETGTGKGLLAKAIHNSSYRAHFPFVGENCAAIPDTLFESTLFGTVRGSFTGAENRPGLLEAANKGTVFLDEVNSMPLRLQVKLLRALESGFIRRIGDWRERPIDIRVISAFNEDPLKLIELGRLRSDLFYRLGATIIDLPPLRTRLMDVPLLSTYFIKQIYPKDHGTMPCISDEAMRIMLEHDWPGNIRELRNCIEYACSVAKTSVIRPENLPEYMRTRTEVERHHVCEDLTLHSRLREYETQIIRETLIRCDGCVSSAAQELSISRQGLYHKMKDLGIEIGKVVNKTVQM